MTFITTSILVYPTGYIEVTSCAFIKVKEVVALSRRRFPVKTLQYYLKKMKVVCQKKNKKKIVGFLNTSEKELIAEGLL